MSATKKDIVKSISTKLSITLDESSNILDLFLSLIKTNSKLKIVKLSKFGSFNFKKTPQRSGRNPNTEESYIIPELNKLNFKPANKIKGILN
tara:strand:+ start:2702 stop:2977 length:276 start_codon:yes stop_codon:yes gene_type:complete